MATAYLEYRKLSIGMNIGAAPNGFLQKGRLRDGIPDPDAWFVKLLGSDHRQSRSGSI
jgi:hypothetical protein